MSSDNNPDAVKLLTDDEVAELQARPSTELGGYRRVLLRPRERDALCATVRVLRTERDELRTKLTQSRRALISMRGRCHE